MAHRFIEDTLKAKYTNLNIESAIWRELVNTCEEYGEGWQDLIIELISKIEVVYRVENIDINDFKIHRIQEKYGELRLDIESSIHEVDNLVSEYEIKAEKICDLCGDPGQFCINGDWLEVLCERCANQSGYTKINNTK